MAPTFKGITVVLKIPQIMTTIPLPATIIRTQGQQEAEPRITPPRHTIMEVVTQSTPVLAEGSIISTATETRHMYLNVVNKNLNRYV